ncbi:MAG: PilZ domain-containing protein [Bradyrhizobium sp.]
MAERRKHPRTELNEPAYVSAGGSVMNCVIHNISLDGAAIDVDNPEFVPERFRLVLADHTVHECRVIWIRDKRMGLAFLTPPQRPRPDED